jgi:hypothetical protein
MAEAPVSDKDFGKAEEKEKDAEDHRRQFRR